MNFFGKILGSERDYLIAWTLAEGEEEGDEVKPGYEERGKGVNRVEFFVCNDVF